MEDGAEGNVGEIEIQKEEVRFERCTIREKLVLDSISDKKEKCLNLIAENHSLQKKGS